MWSIRAARDGDAGELIALIGSCFAAYPNCVLAVDGEMPELRRIASAMDEVGGRAWVAEVGGTGGGSGTIVGCVACVPAGDGVVELKKLYVDARVRRRGLGAALVGMVEGEGRRRDAARVELWSDTRFLEAHRLYERLGYRRDGRARELHDLSGTREFFFSKVLTPG